MSTAPQARKGQPLAGFLGVWLDVTMHSQPVGAPRSSGVCNSHSAGDSSSRRNVHPQIQHLSGVERAAESRTGCDCLSQSQVPRPPWGP